MTDIATTSERAAEHYLAMLRDAETTMYVAPVVVPIEARDIEGLEVCNAEVGERHECFELGPFQGHWYLRIRSTDNVAVAEKLRRLADEILDATFDEREALARAAMVECPGCRTRIAPDDLSCGAVRCDRIAAQEARV